MIVKIMPTANISDSQFPAVEYNEKKVEEGVAERIKVLNFDSLSLNNDAMTIAALQEYLESYSDMSNRISKPQFHVTFSEKGKETTKEELLDFAMKWLKIMGYDKNPLLIYFHHDTNNNHLHVVTSRIGPDHKKINHSHERRRSQEAINQITGSNPETKLDELIHNAFNYSFQSLGQFRSILETSGYETYEEEGNLKIEKGGGVISQLPINNIKDSFTFDDDEKRKKKAAQIKAWLLRYKTMCINQQELKELMKKKFGIDLIFHGKGLGNKENKPYGYTVVDHKAKMVFKGSEVLALKQVLEFLPLNKEERQVNVDYLLDSLIEKHTRITTAELNKLLREQVNAYIRKGSLFVNGRESKLKPYIASFLKRNDKLAWINSFLPRTDAERKALATLFKVDVDMIMKSDKTNEKRSSLVSIVNQIAASSTYSNFKHNLSNSNFVMFSSEGNHYVLSFGDKTIINLDEVGIDSSLVNPQFENYNIGEGRGLLDDEKQESILTVDNILDVTEDLISIGDGHVNVNGGKSKDLSAKKKKRSY